MRYIINNNRLICDDFLKCHEKEILYTHAKVIYITMKNVVRSQPISALIRSWDTAPFKYQMFEPTTRNYEMIIQASLHQYSKK
jgi:hypothetical protein